MAPPGTVVRGKTLRNVDDDKEKINNPDYLQRQAVLGSYELRIPQKDLNDARRKYENRTARNASIVMKSATITFSQNKTPLPPMRYWQKNSDRSKAKNHYDGCC
jgi:hypothetical protein